MQWHLSPMGAWLLGELGTLWSLVRLPLVVLVLVAGLYAGVNFWRGYHD